MHTEIQLQDPDAIYAELVSLHSGLSPEESDALSARLILLLINQVGDDGVVRELFAAAAMDEGEHVNVLDVDRADRPTPGRAHSKALVYASPKARPEEGKIMKDSDVASLVEQEKLRRNSATRLSFAVVVLFLFFAFVANWTGAGASLREVFVGEAVTGSLLFFVLLIIVFLLVELIYLPLGGAGGRRDG